MMKKEGARTKRQKGFLICGGERRRGQSCGLASEPASDCWWDLMAPWWLSSRERHPSRDWNYKDETIRHPSRDWKST